MIDMLKWVKSYYYHPLMGGSNSLKSDLPAVLKSSDFLQDKYLKSIYGKNSLIRSLNYDSGWVWIKRDANGNIINPYKLLPPLFDGIEDAQIDEFMMRNDIRNGGSAMTAFAKMQFSRMSETEFKSIAKGLLKYCELDTLAMVMLWEYWNKSINF